LGYGANGNLRCQGSFRSPQRESPSRRVPGGACLRVVSSRWPTRTPPGPESWKATSGDTMGCWPRRDA